MPNILIVITYVACGVAAAFVMEWAHGYQTRGPGDYVFYGIVMVFWPIYMLIAAIGSIAYIIMETITAIRNRL